MVPVDRSYIKRGFMSLDDCLEVEDDNWEWEEEYDLDEDEFLDDEDRSLLRIHDEVQAFEDAQVTLTEYDEGDDSPEEWATYPYSRGGQ
jgi:hypothetical protein